MRLEFWYVWAVSAAIVIKLTGSLYGAMMFEPTLPSVTVFFIWSVLLLGVFVSLLTAHESQRAGETYCELAEHECGESKT